MTHELLLKRDSGDKIKINVRLRFDSFRNDYRWDIDIWHCLPNKRTFFNVENTDDYKWRALSMDERKIHTQNAQLKFVTAEEILQAKTELWKKLKPTSNE